MSDEKMNDVPHAPKPLTWQKRLKGWLGMGEGRAYPDNASLIAVGGGLLVIGVLYQFNLIGPAFILGGLYFGGLGLLREVVQSMPD